MKVEVVEIKNHAGIQAIPLPEGFAIEDDKVYLKKTGNIISIIPYHNPWQNLHESLPMFSDDFMSHREQPDQQVRENFD